MVKVDNLIDLKNKNLKSIIDYQRFKSNTTKKQIAQDLNLSFATVSNMANLLMNIDLIRETENSSSRYVGRSPKYIHMNTERFYIITLDLHMSQYMSLCKIDLASRILCRKTYEVQLFSSIEHFMKQAQEVFDDFINASQSDADKVIGVGVIMPGIFFEQNDCMVSIENSIFRNQPIRKLMSDAIGKPVIIENDTNLAAYFSAISTHTDNLVYLYMGEGLGFGVVTNGNILRGVCGYSSEIDHIPMGTLNQRCPYCGNYDCLHTDVSRNGFLTKYNGGEYEFKRSYTAEWEDYIEHIRRGDVRAAEVARENALILGKGLSAAVCITWPARVVIGAIPPELYRIMMPIVERQINSRKPFEPYITVGYDDQCLDTMAKGAAEMFYSQWMPEYEWFEAQVKKQPRGAERDA